MFLCKLGAKLTFTLLWYFKNFLSSFTIHLQNTFTVKCKMYNVAFSVNVMLMTLFLLLFYSNNFYVAIRLHLQTRVC